MSDESDQLDGVRILYEFSRQVLSDGAQDNLLERLVEATRNITDADEVILFEIEDGCQTIAAVASDGHGPQADESEPAYSRTLVSKVIEKKSPVLLQDLGDDPRFEKAQSVQVLSITSAMGAPLYHEGTLKGIIYAARQRLAGNFTDEHRELMTIVASQASLLLGQVTSARARRESEARYRSLVEMSPSTILVVRGDEVVFANQTASKLWGMDTPESLHGRRIGDLFDPWRSQTLLHRIGGKDPFESVDAWVWRSEPETAIPVEVGGRPIEGRDEPELQLMVNKVGPKKTLLAQRVRADQLIVMGTMAATVGHEINNPLSYVYANLDFVVEELEEWWTEESKKQLDTEARGEIMAGLYSARAGTERIRAIVDSIQSFTRLDGEEGTPTVVSEPLESSLRIARNKLDPEVEVQVDIRPTSPVPISASRLGQVFLNLLVNGAQALAEVDGQNQDKRLEVRSHQVGERVIVEIADNGPGIDPEVRRHIFEPFVSTKTGEAGDDDAGTGLGLAICRDIIDASGGEIEVESKVGDGSLFRVRLPAAEEMATESLEMIPEADVNKSGRILIVDPEPTLARSLERILQNQHQITVANTMGDAVELLGQDRDFDIILCDLRFRGGMGRDLFRWVEEQAPGCWEKMLAMTGKPTSQKDEEYLQALPNPWLTKPFDLDRLRAVIGGLLESEDEDEEVG